MWRSVVREAMSASRAAFSAGVRLVLGSKWSGEDGVEDGGEGRQALWKSISIASAMSGSISVGWSWEGEAMLRTGELQRTSESSIGGGVVLYVFHV